jgi:hypothetical protein
MCTERVLQIKLRSIDLQTNQQQDAASWQHMTHMLFSEWHLLVQVFWLLDDVANLVVCGGVRATQYVILAIVCLAKKPPTTSTKQRHTDTLCTRHEMCNCC